MATAPPIYVLGRFPPPYDGQTILTEQAARILESQWSVVRISTSFQGAAHVETSGQLNPAKLLHYPRILLRARKVLGEHPNAPVIWPSMSPSLFGHFRDLLTIIPAWRRNQKVFAVIHWGDFDRLFRSPLTKHTARLLVRRLSGFVFNDGLAEKCAAWIPSEKRFTISNTIDEATRCTEREVAEKQVLRMRRTSLNVLYLSNMIPSKGYLDVLAGVGIAHGQGLSLHADFVGQWQNKKDRELFMNQVSKLHLDGHVTVHGGISNRAMLKQLYLNADVFVLPTFYPTEAQPVSILEAINAGTPVITTRHAGIPKMLREQADEALFVSPACPEEISRSLFRISNIDCWQKYSNAAVLRFRSHFSPDALRDKWTSMLGQQSPTSR